MKTIGVRETNHQAAGRTFCAEEGFTLVELIVVIAVIAILAAILLPVLAKAKDKAMRTRCLNNVKQLDMAILQYAMEYQDYMPPLPDGLNGYPNNSPITAWEPWTIPPALARELNADGFTVDTLFDPGMKFAPPLNPIITRDYLWHFDQSWRFAYSGYVFTFPAQGTIVAAENINSRSFPTEIQVGPVILPPPDPSNRALLAGLVVSGYRQNDPALRSTYSYTSASIWTAIPESPASPTITDPHYPYQTCHWATPNVYPSGDNVGMLDGSAAWRNFGDMVPRTVAPSWISATFWW